jgi:hypothetical protein
LGHNFLPNAWAIEGGKTVVAAAATAATLALVAAAMPRKRRLVRLTGGCGLLSGDMAVSSLTRG